MEKVINFFITLLKSALTILFLFVLSLRAEAQVGECNFYIHQSELRKKVRYSLYPMNFSVTESMEVLININDKGKPGTIEIVFDFEDSSGLPVEPGSTLSINFMDNTTYSIIANARKIKSSIAYFTLSEASFRPSTTKQSNTTDTFLADKLSKVGIRAFEISADYKKREIPISETKSAIIKNTILCLLAGY